jgi:hypothetical protein
VFIVYGKFQVGSYQALKFIYQQGFVAKNNVLKFFTQDFETLHEFVSPAENGTPNPAGFAVPLDVSFMTEEVIELTRIDGLAQP